jgi:hypothetical protein
LDRFETELDNVRLALTWALDGGSLEAGLRLASDLGVDTGAFWVNRGHMKEGHEFLEQLLLHSQSAMPMDALAAGYYSVAVLEFWLHDFADAHRHVEQSESLWSQLGPECKTNAAQARLLKLDVSGKLNLSYDPIEMCQRYRDNLRVFQEAGDRWMMAHVLFLIAFELDQSGDSIGARQNCEQSRTLFQECGDVFRVSKDNLHLAILATCAGEYAEARRLCEESLMGYRQLRFAMREEPLWMLGAISIIEGNFVAAKAWYTECLLFDQEIGSPGEQLPECLIGFASIASSERRFERASQLIGAVESVFEARKNSRLETFDQEELERLRALLRGELGDASFEAFVAQGRLLAAEQATAFALERSTE